MKKVISFLCAVSVMFSASAFSADVSALETLETIIGNIGINAIQKSRI